VRSVSERLFAHRRLLAAELTGAFYRAYSLIKVAVKRQCAGDGAVVIAVSGSRRWSHIFDYRSHCHVSNLSRSTQVGKAASFVIAMGSAGGMANSVAVCVALDRGGTYSSILGAIGLRCWDDGFALCCPD